MRSFSSLLAVVSLVAVSCTAETAGPTVPATPGDPTSTTTALSPTSPAPSTTATSALAGSRPPFCEQRWEPQQEGAVASIELTEISGAAVSRTHEDVLWLHNDSGSDPVVYAARTSGADLGRISLPDLSARDWEDMALGPGPDPATDYLYLADIGDNSRRRDDVRIHRIPEPNPTASVVSGGETLVVTYPEGPIEAETLLVDPATGDLVIVGKAVSGTSALYGLAGSLDWSLPQQAVFIGLIQLGTFALATGGDAGSNRVVIRTYDEVFSWDRGPGQSLAETLLASPCRIAAVREQQGEAIALSPDGSVFYTTSEGLNQPVYRFAAGES